MGKYGWLFAILVSFAFFVSSAFARNYALLVGVGNYPGQQGINLAGPPNDVRLMSRVLQPRGFVPTDIRTLTDGMENDLLPTRKSILNALTSLAGQVEKDDFVYLHFGGHGARQPQPKDAKDIETDGLDEIFLPRDIGQWSASIQSVENAITDNEFNRRIMAIRRKGAFVWAVFDTCHSGTMVRGAPVNEMRYRRVDESLLGIPDNAMQSAQMKLSSGASKAVSAKERQTQAGMGGYIAFYAAQPKEQAPEMMLPLYSQDRKWHGMLTYTLAQILSRGQQVSYRQTMQYILQQYASFNLRSPTPLFEGSSPDAPLLGQQRMERVYWPLTATTMRITVSAGSLAGVGPGSVFAMFAEPDQKNELALGYFQVASSDAFESTLIPVAFKGVAAIDTDAIPRHAWVKLVHQEVDFSVTVAKPGTIAGLTKNEKNALDIIKLLASKVQASGIRFQWVEAGESADIRLGFSPRGGVECPVDRIWMMSSEGKRICNGPAQNISILLNKEASELRETVLDTLQSMAKVLNLQRVAANLVKSGAMEGLDVRFEVVPVDEGSDFLLPKDKLVKLSHGDKVNTVVVNNSKVPYDISVLFIDGYYGIVPVFPRGGQIGRIEAGDKATVLEGTFVEDTRGIEHLLIICVEAEKGKPVVDFGFLAQSSLTTTRNIERGDEDIQLLFKAAGFGINGTRGAFGGFGRQTGMSVYRWIVESNEVSE